MKKINIDRNKLKELYEKGITIPEISRFFDCSANVIYHRMKLYRIKPSRSKFVNISKEELERLYLKEKLSTREISKKFGCGKTAISSKMEKCGIRARSKSETSRMIKHPVKYNISKEELMKLYHNKKLSLYQIARLYGCSPSAIFYKMKKYSIAFRKVEDAINLTIERRSRSIAKSLVKRERKDFSGSSSEKAYLIGFRLGDLHVSKKKYGETILVSTTTTKEEQVELLRNLLSTYGGFYSRKYGKNVHIVCGLNTSFGFLLSNNDEIAGWINYNMKNFLNFLAGYIDAEGSFGVYKSRAEFFVGSYPKNIINTIYENLKEMNFISPPPRIRVNAGYVDKRRVKTYKDLWGLKISREPQLLEFVRPIKPFLKHAKRLSDAGKVENHLKNKLEQVVEA